MLAEQFQQLTAAAADVEHIGRRGEKRQVGGEPSTDVLRRSAEAIFETQIHRRPEIGERRGGAGSGGGSRTTIVPASELPLHHNQPLLNQADLIAKLRAAGAAILRVHVRRHGLQKLEQQPFEAHDGLELPPRRVDERGGRSCRLLRRRDVAIDVIDEGGVETLLRLERRPQHTPDEAAQAALERTIGGRPPPRAGSAMP